MSKPVCNGSHKLPSKELTRWCACLRVSSALALRPRTCSFTSSCRERCGIEEPLPVTQVSRARPTKAAGSAGRRGSPERATHGFAEGITQLAWRFLKFQKGSALAQWYRERTAGARRGTGNTMIVALARKLLIALWRLVTAGEVPAGVVMRPA